MPSTVVPFECTPSSGEFTTLLTLREASSTEMRPQQSPGCSIQFGLDGNLAFSTVKDPVASCDNERYRKQRRAPFEDVSSQTSLVLAEDFGDGKATQTVVTWNGHLAGVYMCLPALEVAHLGRFATTCRVTCVTCPSLPIAMPL